MEFLMAFGTSIVSKIGEYTVEPVGRQLGYLIFCGSNVNNLRSQIRDLEATKASLQHTIEQATRRGEEINEIVTNWLADANTISEMVNKFLNDDEGQLAKTRCSNGNYFFPNLLSRHRLSRKAKRMTDSVSEIKVACNFDNGISYVPKRKNIVEIKGGFMNFDTRNSTVTGILEALCNNEIRSIGVYGMAGIGKTTLVKAVARIALDEKLFSDAVEITVSESPNLEKIQKEIAERLDLVFNKDDPKERAVELRYRLKKEEKFLIILDDVWKKLDLLDIGIAFEDDQKGCKILLTSRSQNVLRDEMGVKNNFQVALLSESEAWACFSNIVGDDLLSDRNNHEFNRLATQIVKECACLPIAIITVAGALKNKRLLSYWRDALRQLQRSTMDRSLYTKVKLSYDFLEDEEAQMIFKFCSLREEDANISIHGLLNLVTGWGLLQNAYTLEEARDRLEILLDKLKSHGLLLNGTDGDSIKMHDVIRDVGITIASEDPNNMYNIRSNDELEMCLENDKLKDAVAISLGANYEDHCLPPRLKCPKLYLLWMWRKNSVLPDHFFEETKELRVLNLSYLFLEPLPKSFCFLQNLQALHLCFAKLGDVDLIGDLKKLKVLDLGGSTLVRLGEQIGQLSYLRVLNLRNCKKLKVIPPNVISRLVNLEELNMEYSFMNWKVEGVINGKENNASLSEIKNLAKLTTLFLNIPEANMLPQDLFSTQLKRFNISLGSPLYSFDHLNGSRALELMFEYNRSRLLNENGFKMLLNRSEELYIYRFNGGLKNLVFDQLDREEGFPHLKYLKVGYNEEIQCITESMEHNCSNQNVLPSLETFSLQSMNNLENICFGELTGPESLGKLREAKVQGCGKLKSFLSLSIAKKLEKIEVDTCDMMEKVVTNSADHDHHDSIEFSKLKEMKLFNLPKLIGFWLECDKRSIIQACQGQRSSKELLSTIDISASTPLFNEKVAFPSLESLELWYLKFERIWSEASCNNYKLQKLRNLTVVGCHSLKYLFSFPIAGSLSQLERLEVDNCGDMEEILLVNSDDHLPQMDHRTKFPKLKALELGRLPYELIKFCSESESCHGRQGSHSDIHDQINSASAATTFFNPKVIGFPSLETLQLREVNMRRLWLPDHQLAVETSYNSHLQNLRKLFVTGCHRLKYLFPFAIAQCLVQLQELKVSDCRGMEELLFINYKELPCNTGLENNKFLLKLQDVSLKDLPSLTRFCSSSTTYNIVNWGPNIKEVTMTRCPNLFAIADIDKQENHDDQYINSSDHKLKVGFPDDQLEICHLNYSNEERLNDQFPAARFYISNITTLIVRDLYNLEYLMSASVATSFVHLKNLHISECMSMKEVVVSKEFRQGRPVKIGLFRSLEYVTLSNLPYLESFCRGYNEMEYLLNLKQLVIEWCRDLTTFISNSKDEEPQENLVSKQSLFHDQKVTIFPNLKSLSLSGPTSLHHMGGHGKSRSAGDLQHGDHEEFLSNLVMLKMEDDVPKLFMDILGSHQYQARTTIFQNLECLQLENCGRLKKLLMPSWVCFQTLTVLSVRSCDGMAYLLTPSTAKSLQLLKVLLISWCGRMREIIHAKDDDDDELQGGSLKNNKNNIVFHHLEFLVLSGLTSLTCFHSGNCALEFPKLSQLVVGKCPKMRNFCAHVIVTAPKLHTFINTSHISWIPRPMLDSNDHVQVDYTVYDEDNMNIEQCREGGADKNININIPIRHFWEKNSTL